MAIFKIAIGVALLVFCGGATHPVFVAAMGALCVALGLADLTFGEHGR